MTHPWRSDRLIYRAVEVEDEPFLSSLSNDGESFMNAAPFIPTPHGKESAKNYREWITSQLMSAVVCLPPPVTDPTTLAADDKTNKPIPIGVVNLMKDDPRFVHIRRSEIGITIARGYQGKGWVLNFGFRHCNLHRVAISAFEYNEGAIRLYERLGFQVEGRKRDFLWHDGRYWEMVEMAMLEDEWRELYGSK
ncbi:uncharacterized protein LTR77_002563 [Saxophila tyrrhenica]|uniref:N-acetyltransferase domain-containing protein n=1 Tax=Saxophila tyrrhenica TaxID=1690608 RepID=A0AAV9PJA2_9PEZI|nr:hypothetical protein LTR77_002563 [Saxophila tyrrhenica]